MIQTAEIKFNLNEFKLPTIICRNEETGRQIQFTLVDDSGDPITLPNTATFTFMMIKPDGNIFESSIPSGLLTISDQLTASGGLGHYAVKITDTDTLIYSGQGGILIDDHLITDDTIDSISEIYGLHFPEDFLTIYSSVAVLDDTTTSTLSTWSSSKIAAEIAAGSGADLIDDNVTSTEKTWSSDKIATELNGKPDVDDTAQNYSDTWSSEKINNEIQNTTHIADNAISNNSTWSSQKISDEISGSSGTINILWAGNVTASTSGDSIILSDSIANYDLIVIVASSGSTWKIPAVFPTSAFSVGDQIVGPIHEFIGANCIFTTNSTITFYSISSGYPTTYTKVIGIKF